MRVLVVNRPGSAWLLALVPAAVFAIGGFMLMDVFVPLANTTSLFWEIWSGLGPNSGIPDFLKVIDECGLVSARDDRLIVAILAGVSMWIFSVIAIRSYIIDKHLPTKNVAVWVTLGLVSAMFAASAMIELYRPLANPNQATACVSSKRVVSF